MTKIALVLGAVVTFAAPAASKKCIASAEHGQQLKKDGKLIEASGAFQECSASECPAVIRRDCGLWVEDLEGTIPTVTFKLVDDSGKETTEGKVLVDEEAVRLDEGRALQVNPGSHKFTWLASTGRIEQQLVVRESEKGRVVTLRMEPRETPPPPPPSGPGRPSEPGAPPNRGPLPWIAGVGGVALGITGITFWSIGIGERNNLARTCARTHACSDGDVDASRTKLVIGDVLVGVGVLAIGVAVYLFLRHEPPTTTAGIY